MCNQVLKQAVYADRRGGEAKKRKALRTLSKRNINVARRAIPCGAPDLARDIILQDEHVQFLLWRHRLEAYLYLLLSLFPASVSGRCARYFTQIKPKLKEAFNLRRGQ